MVKKLQRLLRKSERGQAIILIAFALVGLIAMVGLVTDGGILLIEYARLKRAIDSASISAALQFRKGFSNVDLENAALQFLEFNQSDVENIEIDTCDTDVSLCTTPRRKLVRVTASRDVRFGFLRVIGITGTSISATSVGEAASIDLVFVIDTSISMAYETNDRSTDPVPDAVETLNSVDPSDDPRACNLGTTTYNGRTITGICRPLLDVKKVALDFVETLFFPYDRVAIVTMTSQDPDGTRDPVTVLDLDDNYTSDALDYTIQEKLADLTVFEPVICNTPTVTTDEYNLVDTPTAGPCVNYDDATNTIFENFDCPRLRTIIPNPESCTSSNVGGALLLGGSKFMDSTLMNSDSFWVLIALIGGPANASSPSAGDEVTHPYGYCPDNTHNDPINPFCRDADASTRHAADDPDPAIQALYDAEDYARDMADGLADPVSGNGITFFTIGLGNTIRNASKGEPYAGEYLLEYIAEEAGDDMENDPPEYYANHGQYFYSPDSAGLDAIFSDIASNIFTRLSQ